MWGVEGFLRLLIHSPSILICSLLRITGRQEAPDNEDKSSDQERCGCQRRNPVGPPLLEGLWTKAVAGWMLRMTPPERTRYTGEWLPARRGQSERASWKRPFTEGHDIGVYQTWVG